MVARSAIPASRIDMVYTLSGLRAYLEAQRAFDGAQYDALHEAAAALKGAVRKYARSQGSTNMISASDRAAISRIIKPFERAADNHMASQTDLAMVWNNALRLFVPEQKTGSKTGTFDPQK